MTPENTVYIQQPKTASKNMQFLKNSNRAAVIRALAFRKASNRTELASYLNLTRMAISNIVNELKNESFVSEISYPHDPSSDTSPPNGRHPKQLFLTPWTINAICINIHRYSVSSMLMDINGNVRYHSSVYIPEDADNGLFLDILIRAVQQILDQSAGLPITSIGISSIGPLDIYKKRILNPPDFRHIRNIDIGDLLEKRFHLPVYIDNDMNCSSLAEFYFGSGISHRDLVFLGFSAGVGAGIIMNERIIHGFGGFAGEVGHISINPNGPLCSCGQRGCIELYTSGENILRNLGLKNFDELNALLDRPNPPMYISNCINEYLSYLRTLMVLVANSYDPDIVILGDIDANFIGRYIPELEEYMNTHMLNQGYKHISIVSSKLGDSAPLYGAGSIVFQRIFDGEILLNGISE